MTLSALIRKRETRSIATAIPATTAIRQGETTGAVAKVATLAVATSLAQQTIPMTAEDEMAVLAWLALIDETDSDTVSEVLSLYRRLTDARDYFTGQASEDLPKPDPFPDDRRYCSQCLNLRGRVCTVAKPGGVVSANYGYRPDPNTLQRCAGYASISQQHGHFPMLNAEPTNQWAILPTPRRA